MKQDLSKLWSNLSLSVVVLLTSLIPNIGLAVLVALLPPKHSTVDHKFVQGHTTIIEIHTRIEPTSNYIFTSLATMYICVFLAMVLIMGLRNRKIKMKNFNNSGQIYLLLAVLVISIFLAMSIVVLFLVREQELIANAVMTTLFLGLCHNLPADSLPSKDAHCFIGRQVTTPPCHSQSQVIVCHTIDLLMNCWFTTVQLIHIHVV